MYEGRRPLSYLPINRLSAMSLRHGGKWSHLRDADAVTSSHIADHRMYCCTECPPWKVLVPEITVCNLHSPGKLSTKDAGNARGVGWSTGLHG